MVLEEKKWRWRRSWRLVLLAVGIGGLAALVAQQLASSAWILESSFMEVLLSLCESVHVVVTWLAVELLLCIIRRVELQGRSSTQRSRFVLVSTTCLLVLSSVCSIIYSSSLLLVASGQPWPAGVLEHSRHLCASPRHVLGEHPGAVSVVAHLYFTWRTWRAATRWELLKDGRFRVADQEPAKDSRVEVESTTAAAAEVYGRSLATSS